MDRNVNLTKRHQWFYRGKLTTYQELLTLASDLNQPDLVYKFMQLARHNATWNSKMGAAHGFGALLENAKEELEPYFKQLVPKLFRYSKI